MRTLFDSEKVSNHWKDWKWQFKHRLHNKSDIKVNFPNLSPDFISEFKDYCSKYNFAITPYLLSLVELDNKGNPLNSDPIWKQFGFHSYENLIEPDYDESIINWENPDELYKTIFHQKYPGRAILRLNNTCFSYCNYCYLTHRTLDLGSELANKNGLKEWERVISHLKSRPDIYEVLLSGGDPLVLNNKMLDRILFDLRNIDSIKFIRINTRAFTSNPFRIDDGFVELVKKHKINAIEVHFGCSKELTNEVDEKLLAINEGGGNPLILWRSPLLKGVNDTKESLIDLLLNLYKRGILPYYLFHYSPNTMGRSSMGVSIKKGIKILNSIRRDIPGPAFPQFTLFHESGKHDIPLEVEGTPSFVFKEDKKGNPLVRFLNWKNNWVEYYDIKD